MPDIKVNVTADISGVTQAVKKVQSELDGLSNSGGKKAPRARPDGAPGSTTGPATGPGAVDLKAQDESQRKSLQSLAAYFRSRAAIIKQAAASEAAALAASGGAGKGGSKKGKGSSGGAGGDDDPNTPPLPPAPKKVRRGRHAYTYSPDLSDIGRNLASGFGGGFSMVGGYATRGALAGANAAEGGGMLGGGMGLLKGAGIGALAFGALKLGQMGSEGMDMAKERNGSLDTLKRQMGDLGVSFSALKAVSDAAADGMGINSKEAAELAVQFNKLSRGAENSPDGLADAVRTGTGLSKAYGLDPSAGVSYLGNMRNVDPRQNNRDLAIMLADTIARSGMNAKADEVMQAMTSFAQSTARLSLSAPNMGAYSGAYSTLMGAGYTGMTSEGAAGLLQQANGAMTHMGAMGEASQNFTYTAMRNAGGTMLNPFTAKTLAEGGLFGSRSSVFADGTPLARLYGRMGKDISSLSGGSGADTTNLEAMVDQFERSGGTPDQKNNALQNHFGLGSTEQAAALYNMALDNKGQKGGGLIGMMKHAGINPMTVNSRGLQTMAQIGKAGGIDDLQTIYGAMAKRGGKAALTGEDNAAWKDAQKGGDFSKMQEALLKISASKDKEETDASRMTDGIKAVEVAQTKVGDALLVPLNTMRDALLKMSGFKSPGALHEAVLKGEIEDVNSTYSSKFSDTRARWAGVNAEAQKKFHGHPVEMAAEFKKNKALEAKEVESLQQQRDTELSKLSEKQKSLQEGSADDAAGVPLLDKAASAGAKPSDPASRRARIAAMEKAHGMPAGLMLGKWGAESSFGANIKRNEAGAAGHFQFMEGTAKKYGVKIGDFDSELDGAARYMDDLYKEKGSWKGAEFRYNGVKKNIGAGEDHWRKVQKFGGFQLDDATPMDMGKAGAGAGAAAGGAPQINVNVNVKHTVPDGRGGARILDSGTAQLKAPKSSGSHTVEAAL